MRMVIPACCALLVTWSLTPQQRLIISDPAGKALHVLDPKRKASFRIVADRGRCLGEPMGVAVDAADNIYIADAARGLVVVFDHNGSFLRYIGNYHGEPQYARPTGIAIDPESAAHLSHRHSPQSGFYYGSRGQCD